MIRSQTVRARDGGLWRIRRHWARRPRLRGPAFARRGSELWEHVDGEHSQKSSPFNLLGLDEISIAILVVLALIFVVIPLLLFAFEALILVPLLVALGVLGRVLFRRPWMVEAARVEPKGEVVVWKVVGWGASDRAADQMAGMIRATSGVPGAPTLDTPRAHRRARH